MDMLLLGELGSQLVEMCVEFETRDGCKPTVAIVNTALMRKLVGDVPNCVVFLGGLVVLAAPTVENIELTALEIPNSLRPSSARLALDAPLLH